MKSVLAALLCCVLLLGAFLVLPCESPPIVDFLVNFYCEDCVLGVADCSTESAICHRVVEDPGRASAPVFFFNELSTWNTARFGLAVCLPYGRASGVALVNI